MEDLFQKYLAHCLIIISTCFHRWKEVTQWVTDKLSLNHSLAFSYFDEEGDLIFVSF